MKIGKELTETVIYRRRRDPDFYTNKGAGMRWGSAYGYFIKVSDFDGRFKYVEMLVPPKDAVIIDV